MDEKNWRVFVNCRWDSKTDTWEMMKKPVLNFITAKK
jgi:adenylylsulfate reductase subunit A